MKGDQRFVAITVEDVTQTHLPHYSQNYATLCGLDGDHPFLKQFSAKPGNKVDCAECSAIFDVCSEFRASDFKRQII